MGSTSKTIPILLVTANVGSIFEDPEPMLKIWTEEFLATVSKLNPKFIALHCQEVGGKNYENSMRHVEDFVNLLMQSNELRLFDRVRVYLDEDYSSAENFTALGNVYFVHESIENVMIWNFKELEFEACSGKEIHSGNIESVVTKEKAKFPQDFFPKCKWSRKGFLRTRWSIEGTVFDLINIHLFHDASNFIAMEEFPSVYCKNRRRALEHTLQRFHDDEYGKAPYFLFGDFNFRTDTDAVVKKLTEGLRTVHVQNNKNNELTKLQYTNEESELILTVGKKEFNHSDHQNIFLKPSVTWLKTFDKEMSAFEDNLTEYPVTFQPSYPFEESVGKGSCYMQTRCPAWCDRVLISHAAKALIAEETDNVIYDLMGRSTCMGDHKPVYLRATILSNSGIIKCCDHAQYECLPVTCQCCRSFASVTINVIDMSDYMVNTRKSYTDVTINSNLLHEPITRDMLSHEPYTPESADSHSPNPESKIEIDLRTLRRNSVSPQQLKRRLETFLLENSRRSPMTRSVSHNVNVSSYRYGGGGGGGQQQQQMHQHNHPFRTRTMSEHMKSSSKPKLISSNRSMHSLARLHSHHSSSDEDWFEFEETAAATKAGQNKLIEKIDVKAPSTANKVDQKRSCCCIF